MEIRRTGESLPNNARSHNGSVLNDQLTVRFVRKDKLCQGSHNQGINKTKQSCGGHRHQ